MKRFLAVALSLTLFLCSLPSTFAATKSISTVSKTIVVDAGHGGYDGGAVYEGICEKDINLSVALKLEKVLKERGYKVVMTRSTDKFVKLRNRAYIANSSGADLFVSLHANAAANAPYFAGVYTYRCPGSSRGLKLANAIQSEVCAKTGAINRGVLSEKFYVVTATTMPAVLVEMGFMSNHNELMKLIDSTYQDKIVDGIAQGIDDYLS